MFRLLTAGAVFALIPMAARAALPEYRGVNDSGDFGLDDNSYTSHGGNMKTWGVDIVREDVFDFDAVPMGTNSTSADGSTLHGLQSVVNDINTNVGASTIQILCPFSWDNTAISGDTPDTQSFYSTYKTRLTAMATQFATQSNVWIELWNEPFTTANPQSNGSSLWVKDMESMIDSVRNNTGYTGKIVVPAADFSGDETTILDYGKTIDAYDPDHNVVFDLHAYSNFINGNEASEQSRLANIKASGNDVIFGEVGPAVLGTSNTQDVSTFITALKAEQMTGIAWHWNDADDNTLHNSDGSLNNTAANYNWASQWMAYTEGSAAALPEPSLAVISVVGMGALVRRRRVR